MATRPAIVATLYDSLLTAAEIGGNRLLGFDPDALARCAEMQGCCIAIDVSDPDLQVYCRPGNWGIRLSSNPPAREVDARIGGRLLALINLAAEEDKLSTSMQGQVSFHGKAALAQKLQQIIAELDIDWEEILAQQLGDVLAVQIVKSMRGLGDWLRQDADSVLQTSSEYLREEARLSPTQVEFDRFQSRLTELKHDVARVEARLQHLLDPRLP